MGPGPAQDRLAAQWLVLCASDLGHPPRRQLLITPVEESPWRSCAFLCSAQAGFISGQNLQLDGGSYQGLI